MASGALKESQHKDTLRGGGVVADFQCRLCTENPLKITVQF